MLTFEEMVHGVDISRYQGGAINWPALRKPAGYPENSFCTIQAGGAYRATGMYTDRHFEVNARSAPAHFEYIGFYWLFVPRGGAAFAQKQAQKFFEIARGQKYHFLAVDVELQPWGYTVSKLAYQQALKAFVDEVKKLTGVVCDIYTRASFWNYYVGSPTWATGHPLWVARYSKMAGPWSDNRFRPTPWADMQPNNEWEGVTWQHSADNNNLGPTYGVASDDIDRNVFNGTIKEWEEKLVKYGNFTPPTPPPPADLEKRVSNLEVSVADIDERVATLEGKIHAYENGG